MARDWPTVISTMAETIKAQLRTCVLGWAFSCGAGDGNRTRTVSLGS
jgi:hypothetical protein